MQSVFAFEVRDIAGKPVRLNEYRDKVLLIVNTASRCGFTPQYQGLEQLFQRYSPQGLVVLGFPCNQFGAQEPGSNQEIADFCAMNFNVSFPMFEKIDVNGDNSHPLFKFLTSSAPGLLGSRAIKWNFTKFLISRQGTVFKRYSPFSIPVGIETDIRRLLQSPVNQND